MKQIIYGGAFNPPTIGHYKIAKELLKMFPDYELIIMPSNSHYQKNDLASFIDRYKMCEIMREELVKDLNACVIISDYETKDNQFVGTVHTLRDFNHPYFVIGADSLDSLEHWIDAKELMNENHFVVFPRNGYDINAILERDNYKLIQDHFIIMKDFDCVDVSSTEYRTKLDKNKVLKQVNDYILKNKLYQSKEEK